MRCGEKTQRNQCGGGVIEFHGSAFLAEGILLRLDDGCCCFGENIFFNRNCSILCAQKITFGNNVLVGWEVNIRDSNGHQSYYGNCPVNMTLPVYIGDHVWIAACADVLKGVRIQNGSIISYRSLVTHSFEESNILIAGAPAKQIRRNVSWKV